MAGGRYVLRRNGRKGGGGMKKVMRHIHRKEQTMCVNGGGNRI